MKRTGMTRTGIGLAAAMAALAMAGCAGLPQAGGSAAERRFEAVSAHPPELRAFLQRMPKGADLHSHLSGAAYAESFVRAAAAAGLCFDTTQRTPVPPPCDAKKGVPPAAAALTDPGLSGAMVEAFSMRDFVPSAGISGHDQFFATFGRFGAAKADPALLAAEVVDRAGHQRVNHVELMTTVQGGPVRALADSLGPWTGDVAAAEQQAMAKGMPALVEAGKRELDAAEARRTAALGCGTAQARPGCAVSVRYLQQVSRNNPPMRVFAQTLYAFLLAQADPRIVGLNFVGPEDNPVALADYGLHMRMLDHLHRRMPSMNVALHAGELTLGLVPPEDLRGHIRAAVELGHAKRIGHGVDIMYEDDPYGLLRAMAQGGVAVEINLTSNDVILGVRGAEHPFPVYRAAGVPTVISTDDEGVSRIDLTNELKRAVETFDLRYADVVALARASLEHSFLPGASLWADPRTGRRVPACAGDETVAECRALLDSSEKARRQRLLDTAFRDFEREVAEGRV